MTDIHYPRRYTVAETSASLTIEGPGRVPVRLAVTPTCFHVESGTKHARFGFYSFGKLVDFAAEGLMLDWERPQRWRDHPWHGVEKWALGQTKKAINRLLHPHWQRSLEGIDPTVLAVHRAVYAATLGQAELALSGDLYRQPHLVRDVLRYRAAAVALATARTLSTACLYAPANPIAERVLTRRGTFPDRDLNPEPQPSLIAGALADRQTLIEMLAEWRGLFSDTGRPHRSLNITLDRLSGHFPPRLLCELSRLRLPGPRTDRLELMAPLLYVRHSPDGPNRAVLLRAKRAQILETMRLVAEYQQRQLNPNRWREVRDAIVILADYPEPYGGDIVRLARRCIDWHRQHGWQRAAGSPPLDEATRVALPPAPLPDAPGIVLLDTVGTILAEGERMQHCVGTYAPRAVAGRCYLFHIERDGESATVEVDSEGAVVQSSGPRNTVNSASRWGAYTLGTWGRLFYSNDYLRSAAGQD